MNNPVKSSLNEREQKLIQKIEHAKQSLNQLQEKRKKEIGSLAYKHGLNNLDETTLDNAFAKLAKELIHANS